MQKIKNYCAFVIKGLNQERFFNELIKISFVYDINRYERNKTSFKVPLKNYKKVKKLILTSGFEILGQKKRGVFFRIFEARKRYGLIAGVLLCVTFYIFQLPFVWQIKIDGVNENLQREMSSFISQSFIMKKNALDCKEIEIALRNEFKNLSFASVAIIGQSLVINAKEGNEPNEKTGTFEPIVSEYDCKVSQVKLIQGTLAVEVGETIRKGDVIVHPYIIDSYGQEKKVEPKVEITVECWFKGEESHAEEEYVMERTGKSYVENKLYLFGLEIYSHNATKQYHNYEVEVHEKPFSKNNILPFIYKKSIYYEMEHVLKKLDYNTVRENKINSAREKALQNASKYDIIKEERCYETNESGFFYISYYVTVEKEISVKWKFTQNQKTFFWRKNFLAILKKRYF